MGFAGAENFGGMLIFPTTYITNNTNTSVKMVIKNKTSIYSSPQPHTKKESEK